MMTNFTIMLVQAFLWAVFMSALGTSRWIVVALLSVAVWCLSLGETGLGLAARGTTEAYSWLSFLSAGVVFPAFVAAVIGSATGRFVRNWIIGVLWSSDEIIEAGDGKRSDGFSAD